jgi:putative acetyltransferase
MLVIAPDDPQAPDVRALLERHLAFARSASPPDHVHALDVHGLVDPAVVFFSARGGGELMGVGAIKRLDAAHAELKSMHTLEEFRGRGVGRAMLEHLLATARASGYRRVSLETGTMEEFAPARSLYRKAGFEPCPPFADYTVNSYSICMSLRLGTGGPY